MPERLGATRLRDANGASRPRTGVPLASDSVLWRSLLGDPAVTLAEGDALGRIAQVRNIGTGQTVFARMAPARALVALREGEVALGLRTADGTFRTERIVRGPAWLDLSSAWLDEPHAMDARASSPVTVVELPRDDLAACLAAHTDLAFRLIQGLAREVQALAVNTHELMHKDAPARLAQWLRQRCEPVAGREGQAIVQLHERKRDVASQLAITPETLSRLMRSFTRQGVIEVAGYTVRVLDTEVLGQLAEA
ncbi:Crp/Fnr family transcriptional regulator [Ideonella sp. A 288]|uniref:Crp/Fnr family transcriptional regulator n=1 Tax=Ideonella sp. A 288 TaxID=1962181 RepID=UPI001F2568C6|nr:Crp/Fnr family transcriptional regulator [Ideonella sp. A 288]